MGNEVLNYGRKIVVIKIMALGKNAQAFFLTYKTA